MPKPDKLRAPAKINLTLEVLARRNDGYHGVRSVMVPLDLADELTVTPSDRFEFACDRPELGGDDNLAVRALRALGELPPYRVELRKRIPTQAGLGGGSSDAAAILRAAMAGTFGPPRPEVDWLQVARGLGSDVPFFLAATGALVEATGERVTPAGALPRWHVLIVKPPVGVSTSEAYAEIDRTRRPSRSRASSASIALLTALQRGSFDDVTALLENDFQNVVVPKVPEIAKALDALFAAGADNALLAGSGSSVFTLAKTPEKIERILDRLALAHEYQCVTTAFAATPDWRA